MHRVNEILPCIFANLISTVINVANTPCGADIINYRIIARLRDYVSSYPI